VGICPAFNDLIADVFAELLWAADTDGEGTNGRESSHPAIAG
jgi:hypothetical protein